MAATCMFNDCAQPVVARGLCRSQYARQRGSDLSPSPPPPQPDESLSVDHQRRVLLRNVTVAQRGVDVAEVELENAVRAALRAGATWADVGPLVGRSAQAARRRFR